MTVLTFPIDQVRNIYDHIMDPKNTPSPTMDDLFNPSYYPDGKVIEKDGWPDKDKLDTSLLPRSFHLVKDQGCYLMAGTSERQRIEEGKPACVVVYAKGMNPELDDDWYETCRYKVGGDDFSLSIPAEWFDIALELKPNARTFRINFGLRSISLAK